MRNQSLLAAVFVLILTALPSCATRLSCSTSAPRLPRGIERPAPGATDEQRLTGCTRAFTGPDGFQVREVRQVQVQPSCGMDLMATLMTLGLITHSAPHPVHVTVIGTCKGITEQRTYALALTRHTSLWHNLIPPGHDVRVLARALRQAIEMGDRVSPMRSIAPRSLPK